MTETIDIDEARKRLAEREVKPFLRNLNVAFDGNFIAEPEPERIKRLLPKFGLQLLGGQSGAGKTFVGVDLNVAVADGSEFMGYPVRERCVTIILAAEGQGNIDNRIKVAKMFRGITDTLPIAVVKKVPALDDDKAFGPFMRDLRLLAGHLQERWSLPIGLITLDTVASGFNLDDENSPKQVKAACERMRAIGDAFEASFLGIHHFGKNAEASFRGSSAWRAHIDSGLAVLAERNGLTSKVSRRSLAVAKSRVGEEGEIASLN